MSLLNLISKVDDLKSVIDKKTDEIAKDFAKEILSNSLEFNDIQKMFTKIPDEIAMEVMMKTMSIVSKSTSVSAPQRSERPTLSKKSWFN